MMGAKKKQKKQKKQKQKKRVRQMTKYENKLERREDDQNPSDDIKKHTRTLSSGTNEYNDDNESVNTDHDNYPKRYCVPQYGDDTSSSSPTVGPEREVPDKNKFIQIAPATWDYALQSYAYCPPSASSNLIQPNIIARSQDSLPTDKKNSKIQKKRQTPKRIVYPNDRYTFYTNDNPKLGSKYNFFFCRPVPWKKLSSMLTLKNVNMFLD
ncbi:hypothetical protein RFI_08261 [Reticulomyxa filosa]|uniref:Uncharacterized protein n=1 Tax=Reticulomyxa filosa TaxID=46433 RepID=X6NSG9_RETFI|nr:hypothetical protein RFI_08261 [Reticulomyxa filosa]|eukprot:ETO28863.1 hypothetical protein RFI_08261 [Reticulomyxa filosa]